MTKKASTEAAVRNIAERSEDNTPPKRRSELCWKACDDGNTADGDGCDSSCQLENG